MKKCAVLFFVLITKESLCMDLREKRQADMKTESDLEDRYSIPSVQRRWPTSNDNLNSIQWPNSNQRPLSPRQRVFPINRLTPIEGSFPFGGSFPNQGRFPFDGPFPNQGRFPFGGSFPNQGRFPYDGPFPNQGRFPFGGAFPTQGRFPFDSSSQGFFPTRQPTTQKPINRSTTPADNSSTVRDCMQNCPVTAEYNPVCGTNNVTYPNPGRLLCAQSCGISVSLLRSSPCPSTVTIAPV